MRDWLHFGCFISFPVIFQRYWNKKNLQIRNSFKKMGKERCICKCS